MRIFFGDLFEFDGEPLKAHKLFGRHLMGYPVEQMKYQSMGALHLFFEKDRQYTNYKRWLNLSTGVAGTSYVIDGVTHYCVANMPGAVPFTSTQALTNATFPYLLQIAEKGWEKATEENEGLAKGLNVVRGKIVYQPVADAFGM